MDDRVHISLEAVHRILVQAGEVEYDGGMLLLLSEVQFLIKIRKHVIGTASSNLLWPFEEAVPIEKF